MQGLDRLSGLHDADILTLAIEAIGDCVCVLAPDGTILSLNPEAAAALGFDRATAVGRNWLDAWANDDRVLARTALEAAGHGHRSKFEGLLRPASGSKPWVNKVLPVPGQAEQAQRVLVIARDVTEQHAAERALKRAARLQQALIEATSEIVWHLDAATGLTIRRGYSEFTGRPDDPTDMDGWLADVHVDDRDRAKDAADLGAAQGASLAIEYRLLHKSGEWRWVEDHAAPLRDDTGVVTDWVGIITDIHARKSAQQALQKSAEHLRLAVEATGLGTWDVNIRTGERDWSPELFDLMRLPRDTAPQRSLFIACLHPDDRLRVLRELHDEEKPEGKTRASIFRFSSPLGDDRWIEAYEQTFFDELGHPIRRVGTMQDITKRKQAEHAIWLAAHTDALTGVANRALFQTNLDAALADAAWHGTRVGLVLVDLDRFKETNDTLGHDAGDSMLRAIAERLKRHVPTQATVARLGGDEFGVIVPMPAGTDDLDPLALTLLASLKTPVDYAGREVDCSASLGWSMFPDHDQQPSALLKNADVALYAAKSAGRGRALAFSSPMRAELERRLNVLRCAKDALARDAVMPFYQPKVSLQTGEIVGFEALLRWTDSAGLWSPGSIQTALDDPELSLRIGARLLERTLADIALWNATGVPFGHVALNVAAPEFHGGSLSDRIMDALDAKGIRPDQLEIEVTERVLLEDGTDAIQKALTALHRSGVSIALDDFGTGYASLTHLTRFPVSWVKIDRSFVCDIGKKPDAAAIVQAVIGLAHSIRIKVVAEGIETPEQLSFLRSAGCDLGQGFLLARPMSGSRVPHCLKTWERLGQPVRPDSADAPVRRASRRRL